MDEAGALSGADNWRRPDPERYRQLGLEKRATGPPKRRVQLPAWMGAWQPHAAKQPWGAGLERLERRGYFPLSLRGAGFPYPRRDAGVGWGGGGSGQFGGSMDRGTLGGTFLVDPGRESDGQGRHRVAWGRWGLRKDLGAMKTVLEGA